MISKDIEDDLDKNLNFSEYIASFFNPDAVSKIKKAREARKDNRFMSDEDFDNLIKNKDFLKVNYKENNTNINDIVTVPERKSARDVRLPKELSGILKINRENF
jgi:hypothetical protein